MVEDDLTGTHRIAVLDSGLVIRWVEIALGARDGHAVAVRGAGFAAGTRVVVDGQRALTDGMNVKVRP